MNRDNFVFYDNSFMEMLDDYIFIINESGEIYYANNIVLKELSCDLDFIKKINFFKIASFKQEDLEKTNEKIFSMLITLNNTNINLNDIKILKSYENDNKYYTIVGKKEKKILMMDISHELKTPINIIISAVQFLKKNVDEGNITCDKNINIANYLNYIKKNSIKILNLVNTIMDINKIEEGYYKINNERCNIVKLIEDIVESIIKYGENKNLEIIFDTNVEERFILCDVEKIEHILLNLLSNAIKYTNEGGKIKVFLNVLDDSFEVSVKDTGTGIDEKNLDMIFDRYYRCDNHEKLLKNVKGSGMGLYLVKSLLKIQNGTINCKSKLDEGSEFIFSIPIVECLDENNDEITDIKLCVNEYFEV